jgi:hypothetical protein
LWTPGALGSDLKLWLKPESIVNPNRLLQTDNLKNVVWINVTSPTVTSGQADPNGGTSAFLIAATGVGSHIRQEAQGFQVSADDAVSVYWKRGPSHNGTSKGRVGLHDGNGWQAGVGGEVPPADWERVDNTGTLGAGASMSRIALYPDITTGSQSIYFWHPQLESGTSPTSYRANAATAGGIVAQWDDSAGTNHATQGTQAAMPLVQAGVLDGYAGAVFDGVDDTLVLTAEITATGGLAFYVVYDNDVAGSANQQHIFSKTSAQFWSALVSEECGFGTAGGYTAITSGNELAATGSPRLLATFRDGSDNLLAELDGVDITNGTPSRSGDVNGLYICTGGGVAQQLTGRIVEIVAIDGTLSAPNRVLMNTYFRVKYPTLSVA